MKWNLMSNINNHLSEIFKGVVNYLPNLLAAIFIFIAGYFIAKLMKLIILKLSRGSDYLYYAFTEKSSKNARVKNSISGKIAGIGFWLIWLFFIVAAIQFLKIPGMRRVILHFVDYLPHILLSATIIFIGYAISEPIRFQLSRSLKSKGFIFHQSISYFIRVLILLLSVLVGVSQLGINIFILNVLVISSFTALFLAVSFACAYSMIPYIQHIISMFYTKKIYEVGQHVELDGFSGVIKDFSQVSVTLKSNSGEVIVPGKRFFEQTVIRNSGDN